jgi:hypothetical protein
MLSKTSVNYAIKPTAAGTLILLPMRNEIDWAKRAVQKV